MTTLSYNKKVTFEHNSELFLMLLELSFSIQE